MLTFATPTLISGDRSLEDVVAHEVAHSWSGNLVTQLNWNHMWLNEGMTVFIERKIITFNLKGDAEADLEALVGLNELRDDIRSYNESGQIANTKLVLKLFNVDPDDALGTVAEKGFNFLYYLSKLIGQANFEQFLLAYFTKFARQNIDSEQWKQFFIQSCNEMHIPQSVMNQIDWDTWYYGEGMPPVQNKFNTTLADQATDLAKLWLVNPNEASKHKEFLTWSSNQRQYFLDYLLALDSSSSPNQQKGCISIELLEKLDAAYNLSSNSNNSEIKFRWQMLALQQSWLKQYPAVVQFVTSQGRLKFVRPLYKSLYKAAHGGKELALATFEKYRDTYHPLAAKLIAQDLGIKKL